MHKVVSAADVSNLPLLELVNSNLTFSLLLQSGIMGDNGDISRRQYK